MTLMLSTLAAVAILIMKNFKLMNKEKNKNMALELNLIDAHSHPHFSAFDPEREKLLQKMREEGVGTIAVGTDQKTSAGALELAKSYNFIWASIGQHPTEEESFDKEFYLNLAKQGDRRVVAIGECGLDFYRMDEEDKKRQVKLFENQIELAIELSLPLMLHIRSSKNSSNAHDLAFDILQNYKKEFPNLRLHMHFFTAPREIAKKFLELDATFGIPGVVTFAREVQESVEYIPENKILVESDAPYAAPVPFRGQKNSPLYTKHTLEAIAEIKKRDYETLRKQILQNTISGFDLY